MAGNKLEEEKILKLRELWLKQTPVRQAAKLADVSKSSVERYYDEFSAEAPKFETPAKRMERFHRSVERLLLSNIAMNARQAEMLGDDEWLEGKELGEINELAEGVSIRTERIVRFIESLARTQEQNEVIEAECVEDDAGTGLPQLPAGDSA